MKPAFLFPSMAEIPPPLKKHGMKGKQLYQLDDCAVLCTGPGRQIELAMQQYSSYLCASCLVIIGFAGALSPRMQRGELVVCKSFFQGNSPSICANAFPGLAENLHKAGLNALYGNSYTATHIVETIDEKRSLAAKAPMMLVVEMENYWAAHWAKKWGCPLIAVRIVLDLSCERLPNLMDTIAINGEIALWATFCHLLRFPHHMWPMIGLFRHSHLLIPRLSRCCEAIKDYLAKSSINI